MSTESCILTTKDLTILEVMLDRTLGTGDPMASLLRRKINSATVMFREDIPEDVATLSSRVTFRVDGGEADTRILSHDGMASPVGMFLPIASPRGLALLGLSEGQAFDLTNHDGKEERVLLERVLYQPEAARRAGEASPDGPLAAQERRPFLRVIEGSAASRTRPMPLPADGGFDDPGPSAA